MGVLVLVTDCFVQESTFTAVFFVVAVTWVLNVHFHHDTSFLITIPSLSNFHLQVFLFTPSQWLSPTSP